MQNFVEDLLSFFTGSFVFQIVFDEKSENNGISLEYVDLVNNCCVLQLVSCSLLNYLISFCLC